MHPIAIAAALPFALALAVTGCASQDRPATLPALITNGTESDQARPATGSTGLGRYHWRLDTATDAQGKRLDVLFARADAPVQLDFADGRLSVGNTCNRMGGSYTFADGQLTVGRMVQTMMACVDPALAALDDAVASRLQGGLKAALAGDTGAPRLTLTTASGETLAFAGQPTAETRYGSQGETVFLEVAAQTAPCSHPLIPDMQCLQVRERRYDDNGLVAGAPGEWQPLYQPIEGYTHAPGVRNVLRLKRYPIANPPADGSSLAYVLDMVVESEQIAP